MRVRLRGDRKERLEAYRRDWLTFCAYCPSSTLRELPSKIRPPAAAGLEGPSLQKLQKELTKYFDGGHLLTRTTLGDLDGTGHLFIRKLLEPATDDKPADDLALYIFRRWARKCLAFKTRGTTDRFN